MLVWCVVVVADRGRARFITAEEPDDPMFEGGPRLVEREDLINPEGQIPGKELFANPKSGRNRVPRGGPAHGYDDHREQHYDEVERRFARSVADATRRFAESHPARNLVLAAEPRMLGMIRAELGGLEPTELAQDLSWHSLPSIRQVLVRHGLIPESHRPGIAYRPPGQPSST